jgi:adenosylcobinamide hydrolase
LTPLLLEHHTTGAPRPALVWRFARPMLVLSSAPYGGGLGLRSWIINAEVPLDYDRVDLEAHCAELAGELGCTDTGVGMLTATDARRFTVADDDETRVVATVGLSKPTWAASPDGGHGRWLPGTINVVAWLPVRLSPAALVNAVITVTEAKTQALLDREVPGTGTASDAVCIVCLPTGDEARFAGPRSAWGARLARATHAAVTGGIR